MSKIDIAIAEKIRNLYKEGVSRRDIAKIYNISRSTVYEVTKFKRWNGSDQKKSKKSEMSLEEKLMSKVLKTEYCWIWQGATRKATGHGTIGIYENGKGKSKGAHVVSYELFKGKIPKGFVVRHLCHIPFCVNPEHLILGTQKENMNDNNNELFKKCYNHLISLGIIEAEGNS